MARDWQNHDPDEAPSLPRNEWTIGPELAHHIWNLTERTPEVGWSPDPPLMLEVLMGFFPGHSKSDAINSWFFTRNPGVTLPSDRAPVHTWWQIGSRHKMPDPGEKPGTTARIYDLSNEISHPARSKLHAQQYTANGAMFTYELRQWPEEEPTGMIRIPTTSRLLGQLDDAVEALPFERFQMQSRLYSEKFATEPHPAGDGTYTHPHYRPAAGAAPTTEDYKDLFDVAFEYMRRMVRSQR